MLNADINIQSIDYERTFEAMFPLLQETIKRMDAENLLVRLLQNLGETSQSVVTGILHKLSPRDSDKLLCRLVNYYREDIGRQLNALLSANELGDCVSVDWVALQQSGDDIMLTLNNVKINYAVLLKKEQVQQALGTVAENSDVGQLVRHIADEPDGNVGKMVSKGLKNLSNLKGSGFVAGLFHNRIEKRGIKYLEEKYLPEELGRIISDFLKKKGIFAEISQAAVCTLERSVPDDKPEHFLDKDLEFALVDAVTDFLKDYKA